MPREPRIYIEKVLYFITSKSLDDCELFQDTEDYLEYLKSLAELKDEYGFKLFSYCLLPKRLFLLIELQNGISISQVMHQLNSRYTKKYNSRYKKKGHLFQSRFKSILIEKEPFLLRLTRFIHLLPKEVGIINNISSYPFSSYFTYTYEDHQSHAGMQWPNITQEIKEVIGQFTRAKTESEQVAAYEQYMNAAGETELEEVRKILYRTVYVGSTAFKAMIRKKIENHLTDEKRTKAVRKVNPGYVIAGSLVVLFLSATTYFLYNGQVNLKNTLNTTSNGFLVARENLLQRLTHLEKEISSYEQKENFGLGGFAWRLQFRPVQEEQTDETFSDDLQFKNGKVVSAKFLKKGYSPFEYTISRKTHGKLVWQTTQTNVNGDTVRWYGIVSGKNMRGVLTELPAQGQSREFSFKNVDVNQIGVN